MNILSINLEKELIKQNSKTILTPTQLLQIKQYETLGSLEQNDVLQRIGLNQNLTIGKNIKQKLNENLKQTEKFDKKRVFHISQIEQICNKYWLKFLPIQYFKGEIDENLPQKITNFELIYGESVSSKNSFIIAPSKSFELQEKLKDPLFFYKINDEYYYLIHKWGNDLNIFNRLKAIIKTYPNGLLFICLLIFTIGLYQYFIEIEGFSIIIGFIWWLSVFPFNLIEYDELNYNSPVKN